MATPVFCLFGAIIALSTCWFALLGSAGITHPLEVSALTAVRGMLEDPQMFLNNWEKSDPCESHWKGVKCTPVAEDGYLHVKELRLLNMNLSGTLAPELGLLSYTTILNFMWNRISGSIPREIGNMNSLNLLLLSGNQISGPLPDELGYLRNITKFQLDLNYISGPLPRSFANLTTIKHFHMNNNSISGQIPSELSALPELVHMLLDNNNLSGSLPPQLSRMRSLKILQLDNNNFNGTQIPDSYGNMSKLLKLSLRNCSLQGPVPDLSSIPVLLYLDLSLNQLTGSIPTNKLSNHITTLDLSNNTLGGSIPSNFSGLPSLQRLSLENNDLSGDVPATIWKNMTFGTNATLTLDFQNNLLTNIADILNPPTNVSIKLYGNPVCARANELNIVHLCELNTGDTEAPGSGSSRNSTDGCYPQSCPTSNYFEYVPESPVSCFCAAPLGIGLRLRSPSMSDFRPYIRPFEEYLTSKLSLDLYQLVVDSFIWENGPRLLMYLKIFPQYINDTTSTLNTSEIERLTDAFATFSIPGNDTFGPYDLINFTLRGPYSTVEIKPLKSGISRKTLLGIVLGTISGIAAISLSVALIIYTKHTRQQHEVSKRHSIPKIPINTDGIKEFKFVELEAATSSFSFTTQVGQGGYGKVYRGILADGKMVAIKRAQQGSLQGQEEFLTEIKLLSRLHHRNLVSLVGYCYEEGEQMLVYEYMPNDSVRNLLSARFKRPVSFAMRLHIAMGSAKGILYLHTEAEPPIIHRDIKTNNILLDYKFTAKVSDFGISRLAPVPDTEGVATHISTVVRGTPGYLDPEYFHTHMLTDKSDVYSLGIVFLELLTGMRPISHGRNIVREVHAACESGILFSIIDTSMGPYSSECVKKFLELALRCCHDDPEPRPSMLGVVRELENISSMLPESDMVQSESHTTTSEMSGADQPSLHTEIPFVSTDFLGSDLDSGVLPTIRPR